MILTGFHSSDAAAELKDLAGYVTLHGNDFDCIQIQAIRQAVVKVATVGCVGYSKTRWRLQLMADQVLRQSKAAGVRLILTDDQRLKIVAGEEVLVDTKVASYAEIAYNEAVAERTVDLQKRLKDEKAQFEIGAVRSSSVRSATSRRGNGGRGGRGGVG